MTTTETTPTPTAIDPATLTLMPPYLLVEFDPLPQSGPIVDPTRDGRPAPTAVVVAACPALADLVGTRVLTQVSTERYAPILVIGTGDSARTVHRLSCAPNNDRSLAPDNLGEDIVAVVAGDLPLSYRT